MAQNEISSFVADDVMDMNVRFSAIEAEQREVPHWFRGLPLHSEPVALLLDLQGELRGLSEGQRTDPASKERISEAYKKMDILKNFHEGHRDLLTRGAHPLGAVAIQAGRVYSSIENRGTPYETYSTSEHGLYLIRVMEAYIDFYTPPRVDFSSG